VVFDLEGVLVVAGFVVVVVLGELLPCDVLLLLGVYVFLFVTVFEGALPLPLLDVVVFLVLVVLLTAPPVAP
jgi:hypothetical protein